MGQHHRQAAWSAGLRRPAAAPAPTPLPESTSGSAQKAGLALILPVVARYTLCAAASGPCSTTGRPSGLRRISSQRSVVEGRLKPLASVAASIASAPAGTAARNPATAVARCRPQAASVISQKRGAGGGRHGIIPHDISGCVCVHRHPRGLGIGLFFMMKGPATARRAINHLAANRAGVPWVFDPAVCLHPAGHQKLGYIQPTGIGPALGLTKTAPVKAG